ncbi:MAG TPA: glycosyltransferase family 61 protein [Flavipsychrobacter sp.]|nr:glycosyltransferase family 61 protein [Flavipsychrobacter sp.]
MSAVLNKINYWAAPYVWKKKSAGQIKVLHQNVQQPFFNHIPKVTDSAIANAIIHDNQKWDHLEYIKEVEGNLCIDPKSGFLIDEDGMILKESIIFDHYGAYPEKLSFNTLKKTKIPEVVLYDHYWSQNYFHFYSDIFTKLCLLNDKASHLKKLSLVVSKKISETRAFKFFTQFPEAASFNWYVQEPDEIIETKKAYLLQPMPYAANNWNWVKQLAQDYLKPYDPTKKIFINRPAATGRHIANFEEIKPILIQEGFEIEEMEGKTIEEQIALFSSASVVASIHGAAMANIVYCDKRCKILEVTADECINSHYYWLTTSLGLSEYDCLTGTKLEVKRFFYPKGRFFLDAEKTRKYLRKISA